MFCPNCGTSATEETKFCGKCGTQVSTISTPSSHKKNTEPLTEEEKKKYNGINGWLIIVALGLIVNIGYGLFSVIETLSTHDSTYVGIAGIFLYDFLTGVVGTGSAIYVTYLFFNKKRVFPKYFIYLYIYLTTVNLITLLILSLYSVSIDDMQENIEITVRTVIGGIIWGLYVVKSKRSRATFINN